MPSVARDIIDAGAKASGGSKQVAQNADIITMVPDTPQMANFEIGQNS